MNHAFGIDWGIYENAEIIYNIWVSKYLLESILSNFKLDTLCSSDIMEAYGSPATMVKSPGSIDMNGLI